MQKLYHITEGNVLLKPKKMKLKLLMYIGLYCAYIVTYKIIL